MLGEGASGEYHQGRVGHRGHSDRCSPVQATGHVEQCLHLPSQWGQNPCLRLQLPLQLSSLYLARTYQSDRLGGGANCCCM